MNAPSRPFLAPPPKDIQGRMTNTSPERRQRRVDWIRLAIHVGYDVPQIADELCMKPNAVRHVIRENGLVLPKRDVKRPAEMLGRRGIPTGRFGSEAVYDELPEDVQDRIADRLARSGKSLSQLFAEDLISFYKEQRPG